MNAYVDLIRSICDLALSRGKHNIDELNAKYADAKARLCIYGSREVISSFANFLRSGGVLNSVSTSEHFLKMVSLMKSESLENKKGSLDDFRIMLFGFDDYPADFRERDARAGQVTDHNA
jgi:hypothetical protein